MSFYSLKLLLCNLILKTKSIYVQECPSDVSVDMDTFQLHQDMVLIRIWEELPSFYRRMLKCYNKAFVTGMKSDFIKTLECQQLWVNKSITMSINGKKECCF